LAISTSGLAPRFLVLGHIDIPRLLSSRESMPIVDERRALRDLMARFHGSVLRRAWFQRQLRPRSDSLRVTYTSSERVGAPSP
jgi:hypothetical protein